MCYYSSELKSLFKAHVLKAWFSVCGAFRILSEVGLSQRTWMVGEVLGGQALPASLLLSTR